MFNNIDYISIKSYSLLNSNILTKRFIKLLFKNGRHLINILNIEKSNETLLKLQLFIDNNNDNINEMTNNSNDILTDLNEPDLIYSHVVKLLLPIAAWHTFLIIKIILFETKYTLYKLIMSLSLVFEFIIIHFFQDDFTYYRIQYTLPFVIFLGSYLLLSLSIMYSYCRRIYEDNFEKAVRSLFDFFLIIGIVLLIYCLVYVMVSQTKCKF